MTTFKFPIRVEIGPPVYTGKVTHLPDADAEGARENHWRSLGRGQWDIVPGQPEYGRRRLSTVPED